MPILSRFFLVTSQSGVKSMNFSLDGARERLLGQGHAVVECVHAVWTFKYLNGYTVTLRGPMTAHILVTPHTPQPSQSSSQGLSYSLKFDQLQFDANYFDKLVSVDAIIGNKVSDSPRTPHLRALPPVGMNGNGAGAAVNGRRPEDDPSRYEEPRYIYERASLPAEPVNAFGIPQATMRCLEVSVLLLFLDPGASILMMNANLMRVVGGECCADVGSDTVLDREPSGAAW